MRVEFALRTPQASRAAGTLPRRAGYPVVKKRLPVGEAAWGVQPIQRVMRPGWDEYFMEIARTVATRATCPRASVGAVVVRDHRILTTGYNGAPRHVAHCTEVGCAMVNGHCLRSTHAEANAIVQGALHGVNLANSTMYCTHQPCINCSKLLISAGVTRIVYDEAYPDELASALLAEAGVAVVPFANLEVRGPAYESAR